MSWRQDGSFVCGMTFDFGAKIRRAWEEGRLTFEDSDGQSAFFIELLADGVRSVAMRALTEASRRGDVGRLEDSRIIISFDASMWHYGVNLLMEFGSEEATE